MGASAVKRAALNCSLTALDRVVVRGCWRIRCAESSTAQILQQIIQETTNRMNRLQQQESENEWQLLQIKGDIEEERAKTELLSVQVENSNARAAMDGLAEATRVQSFLQGIANDVPGAHVCRGRERERERERECVCVCVERKRFLSQFKSVADIDIRSSHVRQQPDEIMLLVSFFNIFVGLIHADVEKRIALWNVLRKKDALQEVCKNGARLYYTPNDVNLSIEDRSGACVSETSSACKL